MSDARGLGSWPFSCPCGVALFFLENIIVNRISTDNLIIGGGVSGLISSWAFKRVSPSTRTLVLEPGLPGGEFTSGGLKYIHKTDAMVEMFDELELPYSTYAVRGGILLCGEVRPYPQCFSEMSKAKGERVRQDHYAKTRRTSPDSFAAKAMNDPAALGPRRALKCNFDDMVDALVSAADILPTAAKVMATDRNMVVCEDQTTISYKHLIVTIPVRSRVFRTSGVDPVAHALARSLASSQRCSTNRAPVTPGPSRILTVTRSKPRIA